jgi:hypothetical protein
MLKVAPSLPTHDSASIGVMVEYLSLPTRISSPKNTLFFFAGQLPGLTGQCNLNGFIHVSLYIAWTRRQKTHPHTVRPIVKVHANGRCPWAVAVDVGHRAFVIALTTANDADVSALLEVCVGHGLRVSALPDEPHAIPRHADAVADGKVTQSDPEKVSSIGDRRI